MEDTGESERVSNVLMCLTNVGVAKDCPCVNDEYIPASYTAWWLSIYVGLTLSYAAVTKLEVNGHPHPIFNGASLTKFLSDCGMDSPNVCRNL